ncbi:MAG: hypothetical protein KJ069_15955 [Anaerolineae bacterium]|nr:hypothetical protein [Anaerolineae bacterium]
MGNKRRQPEMDSGWRLGFGKTNNGAGSTEGVDYVGLLGMIKTSFGE